MKANSFCFREDYILSYYVDLKQLLPEIVMVGFTAWHPRTSFQKSIQIQLDINLETEEANPLKKRGEVVKIIWAAASIIFVGVLLVGLVWQMAWVMLVKRKKSRGKRVNLISMNSVFQRGAGPGPMQFSYEELASATINFSSWGMEVVCTCPRVHAQGKPQFSSPLKEKPSSKDNEAMWCWILASTPSLETLGLLGSSTKGGLREIHSTEIRGRENRKEDPAGRENMIHHAGAKTLQGASYNEFM
ncbi:L-type lectin-domain-containing protein [Cinnamomum micranthum f. kanehirae]|uniref:L-type lectin-domain-containing protein n=1 Tax=Cinnamomum micranthum f. kanehirae TaxID=337451 RepID=A0A3S3MPH9_9MAGN|nr:L-type lectin-domain-containing protein [Cinnamomum micranthum f. kanehirae]